MFLSTLMTAALLSTGSPLPAQSQPQASPDATVEGVEILRRILVEDLEEAFQQKPAKGSLHIQAGPGNHFIQADGLVTSIFSGDDTVRHSRGFHAPGVGLVYSIDLALPTQAREPAPASADDTTAGTRDDEWERMRREVRGGGSRGAFPYVVLQRAVQEREIDPQAIERAQELLIRALARHAPRIEGLDRQEEVILVLYLSGKQQAFFSTPGVDPSLESEDEDVDEDARLGEVPVVPQTFAYALTTRGEAPDRHLVLRVSVADLEGFADGDYARLAERVRVHLY